MSLFCLIGCNVTHFYISSFFSESDILSEDGMSSTFSAFENKLAIQRVVYFLIFYFVGSDAYYTLFILKVLNGIWNIYYLFNYHFIYSSPIRRLVLCLSGIFTILNTSAFMSYLFAENFNLKLDPLIITIIPGLFLVKICIIKVDQRIYDHRFNDEKFLKKYGNINTILY